MNPNVETSPGMGLPESRPASGQPSYEQAPGSAPLVEVTPAATPESATQLGGIPSVSGVDDTAIPVVTPSVPSSQGSASLAMPATADDGDLIDKEWVLKAKQIVNSTSQDPYQQNRQLAAFKADYLQKRYNKTVKLSE